MDKEPNTDWPIFITGSHRCGSTLLRFILDAHERIACPPESKFIAAFQQFFDYPQVARALMSLGLTRAEMAARIRHFVNSIFADYAAKRTKRRWVDKTPNYYRILPFIDEIFAREVLYVVMVRHPLDCIASLEESITFSDLHSASSYLEDPDLSQNIRRHGKGRFAWARFWSEVYEQIYVFSQGNQARIHVVRYEDLIYDPPNVIKGVLQFMGESYSNGLIDEAFRQRHQAGYQDLKILSTDRVHNNSVGRWRQWPAGEVTALWKIVEPMAMQYGYDVGSDSLGEKE